MTETPYGRYEYQETDIPDDEGWHRDPGPENIWEQQEIEIAGEVERYVDLPTPNPATETDTGQRRTYLVRNRKTIYRDTGSDWEAIAGVGDANSPVPGTSHFERAQVSEEPEDPTDVVRWTDLDGLGDGGGAVDSVFGRTGTVEAESGDYDAEQVGALSESGGTVTGDVTIDGVLEFVPLDSHPDPLPEAGIWYVE